MKTPIITGIIHCMILCCDCWRSSIATVEVILVVMNIEAPTSTGSTKLSGK